ncbi:MULTISPECIES: acyltransferase family protein [Nostocales]|uniref:Acyltransferase n=3 Tax=Nostocales TaxID=1161 RepID=A0A0C1R646_9CYAN|nr:acyltransferase [Tolypothrix bouteillei]KAF3888002.1 acyltransferase [Tolypothrix bouteillei VB521301]
MKTTIETYPEKKIRLSFLDGIRGLAALYVVLCHILPHQAENLPLWINLPTKLIRYGSFSVAVFIVLSGYCLMLPVTRSHTGYIPGSLFDYFKRRARRILPPFYATIVLCCAVALVILTLEKFTTFQWLEMEYDWFSPHFSFVSVILHFLVIYNFVPGTDVFIMNVPLWSVALEWQIYFLFPIIFLPILRRWGLLFVITIAFLIGLTPHYLFNGYMDVSRPWFVGSFTIGMTASEIAFSQKPQLIKLRQSLPWARLATIFTAVAVITHWKKLGVDAWIFETFASIAAACLIIYCTKIVVEGKTLPPIVQLFEHPWAIALSKFSYSLYLTHGLVQTLVRHWLITLKMSPVTFTATLYVTSVGLSLLFAYFFHLLFERPFTSNPLKGYKIKHI